MSLDDEEAKKLVQDQMKKQELRKNSFVMSTEGQLHTIKQTSGKSNDQQIYKLMGLLIITLAAVILIGGCITLGFVAYRLI